MVVTPLAALASTRFYETLSKPVHATLCKVDKVCGIVTFIQIAHFLCQSREKEKKFPVRSIR
jgi:hypothetical protein